MVNTKKDISTSGGVHPVAAAVAGVVVGAVAAGAVVMADKQKQEKVRSALNDLGDKAADFTKKIEEKSEQSAKDIADVSKKVQHTWQK